MNTNRVSRELLQDVLDYILAANGVQACEIRDCLEISSSAVSAAVRELLKLGCISLGAVKYFRKDGEVTLHDGYFYETEIPKDYRKGSKRQRRKNHAKT